MPQENLNQPETTETVALHAMPPEEVQAVFMQLKKYEQMVDEMAAHYGTAVNMYTPEVQAMRAADREAQRRNWENQYMTQLKEDLGTESDNAAAPGPDSDVDALPAFVPEAKVYLPENFVVAAEEFITEHPEMAQVYRVEDVAFFMLRVVKNQRRNPLLKGSNQPEGERLLDEGTVKHPTAGEIITPFALGAIRTEREGQELDEYLKDRIENFLNIKVKSLVKKAYNADERALVKRCLTHAVRYLTENLKNEPSVLPLSLRQQIADLGSEEVIDEKGRVVNANAIEKDKILAIFRLLKGQDDPKKYKGVGACPLMQVANAYNIALSMEKRVAEDQDSAKFVTDVLGVLNAGGQNIDLDEINRSDAQLNVRLGKSSFGIKSVKKAPPKSLDRIVDKILKNSVRVGKYLREKRNKTAEFGEVFEVDYDLNELTKVLVEDLKRTTLGIEKMGKTGAADPREFAEKGAEQLRQRGYKVKVKTTKVGQSSWIVYTDNFREGIEFQIQNENVLQAQEMAQHFSPDDKVGLEEILKTMGIAYTPKDVSSLLYTGLKNHKPYEYVAKATASGNAFGVVSQAYFGLLAVEMVQAYEQQCQLRGVTFDAEYAAKLREKFAAQVAKEFIPFKIGENQRYLPIQLTYQRILLGEEVPQVEQIFFEHFHQQLPPLLRKGVTPENVKPWLLLGETQLSTFPPEFQEEMKGQLDGLIALVETLREVAEEQGVSPAYVQRIVKRLVEDVDQDTQTPVTNVAQARRKLQAMSEQDEANPDTQVVKALLDGMAGRPLPTVSRFSQVLSSRTDLNGVSQEGVRKKVLKNFLVPMISRAVGKYKIEAYGIDQKYITKKDKHEEGANHILLQRDYDEHITDLTRSDPTPEALAKQKRAKLTQRYAALAADAVEKRVRGLLGDVGLPEETVDKKVQAERTEAHKEAAEKAAEMTVEKLENVVLELTNALRTRVNRVVVEPEAKPDTGGGGAEAENRV